MEKIIEYIRNNDNFIITSHVSPDGDNIGSSIAMEYFLKNLGKINVYHVLDDEIPKKLSIITENTTIYKSQEFFKKNISDYTLICLDCANFDRLAIDKKIVPKKIINIDHHISNDKYGDLNYINSKASSSCEVLFDIIMSFEEKIIDEKISTALLAGLITDTGCFMFESAGASSFKMAEILIKKGAKKQDLIRKLYQSENINYKKFEAETILRTLEKNEYYSIMTMEKDLLEKYGIEDKDTETLVQNAINIDGIEIGILLKEKDKQITKGSLRSKKWADVNKIANKLGGGGHIRAAGFTIEKDIEESKKIVEKEVEKYILENKR